MRHEQWLLNLLPQWKDEGLITSETEGVLRQRYASDEKKTPLWFIFLGSLGALLVGLGVITLFAANWKDIGRPARAVLSFIPLCASIALYGVGLWRRWHEKSGFMDVLGILWGLSVGACIALIAQTYQISADGRSFVLTWTLLLLPVMYATRSFIVILGHYVGLMIWMMWTFALFDTTHQHMWTYALALLGLPVALFVMRDSAEYKVRGIILRWLMVIMGCVAYGFVLFTPYENSKNGTYYFFMYGLFFVILAQLGFLRPDGAEREKRPWGTIGLWGSLIVVSLYAFGSEAVRKPLAVDGVYRIGILVAMALLWVVTCGASVMRWRKHGKNILYPLAYGLIPVFCIGLLRVTEKFVGHYSAEMFLDAFIYLIALGIMTLISGISEKKLGRANLGVLILLSVILEKFLWSDLSLTIKGIAFLVSGICFFWLSFFMNKRLSREK